MESRKKKLIKNSAALVMLKKPVNCGIADSSEDIDKHLYGKDEPAD